MEPWPKRLFKPIGEPMWLKIGIFIASVSVVFVYTFLWPQRPGIMDRIWLFSGTLGGVGLGIVFAGCYERWIGAWLRNLQ